ncbi:MAG TPA: DUF1631 domain-containing protein [Rhodanobacteraceae bacterium]|nr:DUF1631 domain-containing protein [Rhodanobacteraceae bacterium]
MSQTTDQSKVVSLGERQPPGERVGELLGAVRTITTTRCRALVASLFEHVDDALFDLAEKAENNAVQTQYFDGMREARKKRQLVERKFLDHINHNFGLFAAAKPTVSRTTPEAAGSDGELSLVDDRELEESLAIASMTSKAENRYARQLYTVNQRLSVICGGTRIDLTTNPLAPAALAQCFRQAMTELEADVKVKLIIYKLFERYALSALDPLYDAVNIDLIRAGVLPQLRPAARRPAGTSAATDAAAADRETAEAEASDAAATDYAAPDGPQARYSEQLYQTVNALLATRRHRGAGSGMPATGHAAQPALGAEDLLAAISLLQQQAPPAPMALDQLDDDTTLSLRQLKLALQMQLRKLGRADKGHVSGADEDTIDLVGMLFEYILQDRNLPAQMQALLGRLQIPYLKVAILDKHAFAQAAHPARQLLDAMADAAKGWSQESDRDLRLFNEVKNVVESLLHSFDDDTAIFERLLARFQQFVASNNQRAELAEQRAAESARGREKLQAARRAAAREVLSRVQKQELPDLIRNVLTRPWANYLVLTLLRRGEDTSEWRDAVRFIDDVVWSARPMDSEADRQRLRDMLPPMERLLRHGLATVAFHESDIKRLMQALGRFYRVQLGEPEPQAGAAEPAAGEDDHRPIIPATIEPIAAPPADEDESPAAGEPAADDRPAMQQARALRVGNWVEFLGEGNSRDRAKLSWISPISAKYLFVNRRGLKVCDMTLQHLANTIESGKTVVLEEVPLFDRALDAIVERLKQDQPASARTATATAPAAAPTKTPSDPA